MDRLRFLGILGAAVAAVLFRPKSLLAADATAAWNAHCATYSFLSSPQSQGSMTFAQAYQGLDFANDFRDLWTYVAIAMGAGNPGKDGNDIMSATLQNWPGH